MHHRKGKYDHGYDGGGPNGASRRHWQRGGFLVLRGCKMDYWSKD